MEMVHTILVNTKIPTVYPELFAKGDLVTTEDILTDLGIKRERLQDWINRGYLPGALSGRPGTGNSRLWTKLEYYSVGLFLLLTNQGLSREVSSRVTKEWYECSIKISENTHKLPETIELKQYVEIKVHY